MLSQDCDLEQDHKSCLQNPEADIRALPNVLFCELEEMAKFRERAKLNSDLWRRAKTNSDERFHCLESVPQTLDSNGSGLPPLGIDFKRYFSVPTGQVYASISLRLAVRRCRLAVPYAEHLSERFAHYLSRVALEEDHDVEVDHTAPPALPG